MSTFKLWSTSKAAKLAFCVLVGIGSTILFLSLNFENTQQQEIVSIYVKAPNAKLIQLTEGWESYYGGVAPKSVTCSNNISCEIIHSYKHIQQDSDLVVLFAERLTPTPVSRSNSSQLMLMYTAESPRRMKVDNLKAYDGYFNYSFTYVEGSDFPLMYGSRYRAKPSPGNKNFAQMKRQNICEDSKCEKVLWFVSNCYVVISGRVAYAYDLNKFIPVSAFTRSSFDCRFRHPIAMTSLLKSKPQGAEPKMSNYYFYLAFENALCEDYITEKFWKILRSDALIIPVVMGGLTMEEYEKIAPPNSYIDVRNFSSPRALATHLSLVADDDQAFNYYHQWRNKYELFSITGKVGACATTTCKGCKSSGLIISVIAKNQLSFLVHH